MALPFEGKVLYTEDLSGRHGLLAGRFGDIVMLNGDNQTRRLLTNDRYYNAQPSMSNNGTRVFFESKREGNIALAGLTLPSKLYTVEIESRDISPSSNHILDDMPGRTTVVSPTVSPTGRHVVFSHYVGRPARYAAVIAGITPEGASPTVISLSHPRAARGFRWSHDESRIALYHDASPRSWVAIVDLTADSAYVITPEVFEGPRIGRGAMNCHTASWSRNSLELMYYCYELGIEGTTFFIHDVSQNESRELFSIAGDRALSAEWSSMQDKVLFVRTDGSGENYDIWLYDIGNADLQQLTHTPTRAKHHLFWHE